MFSEICKEKEQRKRRGWILPAARQRGHGEVIQTEQNTEKLKARAEESPTRKTRPVERHHPSDLTNHLHRVHTERYTSD